MYYTQCTSTMPRSSVLADLRNISSEDLGLKKLTTSIIIKSIMPKGQYDRKSLEERVSALISKNETTGCWVFQGNIDKDGYGQISDKSKTVQVHRAMYIAKNGAIPAGHIAGHLCDDKYPADCKEYRKCCNPEHIRPMTTKENIQRAVTLGRYVVSSGAFKKGQQSGENNTKSKLTGLMVLEIRTKLKDDKNYGDLRKMAEEYGIQYQTIYKISKGQLWDKPEFYPEASGPNTL